MKGEAWNQTADTRIFQPDSPFVSDVYLSRRHKNLFDNLNSSRIRSFKERSDYRDNQYRLGHLHYRYRDYHPSRKTYPSRKIFSWITWPYCCRPNLLHLGTLLYLWLLLAVLSPQIRFCEPWRLLALLHIQTLLLVRMASVYMVWRLYPRVCGHQWSLQLLLL